MKKNFKRITAIILVLSNIIVSSGFATLANSINNLTENIEEKERKNYYFSDDRELDFDFNTSGDEELSAEILIEKEEDVEDDIDKEKVLEEEPEDDSEIDNIDLEELEIDENEEVVDEAEEVVVEENEEIDVEENEELEENEDKEKTEDTLEVASLSEVDEEVMNDIEEVVDNEVSSLSEVDEEVKEDATFSEIKEDATSSEVKEENVNKIVWKVKSVNIASLSKIKVSKNETEEERVAKLATEAEIVIVNENEEEKTLTVGLEWNLEEEKKDDIVVENSFLSGNESIDKVYVYKVNVEKLSEDLMEIVDKEEKEKLEEVASNSVLDKEKETTSFNGKIEDTIDEENVLEEILFDLIVEQYAYGEVFKKGGEKAHAIDGHKDYTGSSATWIDLSTLSSVYEKVDVKPEEYEVETTEVTEIFGNYYLSEDILINHKWHVPTGKTLNLCLNGCNVTFATAAIIYGDATVNLYNCADQVSIITTKRDENYTDQFGFTYCKYNDKPLIQATNIQIGGIDEFTNNITFMDVEIMNSYSSDIFGTHEIVSTTGGGSILYASASVTLDTVNFVKCFSMNTNGAAVNCINGKVEIKDSVFENVYNLAGNGIVAVNSHNFLFEDNEFKNNSVTGNGGAVYVKAGMENANNKGVFTDNVFEGNNAELEGGAIYIDSYDNIELGGSTNNYFENNTAIRGGAIAINYSEETDVINFVGEGLFNENKATARKMTYEKSEDGKIDFSTIQLEEIENIDETYGGAIYINDGNNSEFNINGEYSFTKNTSKGINADDSALAAIEIIYVGSYGGAIYADNYKLNIANAIFTENQAYTGGAICVNDSYANISNVTANLSESINTSFGGLYNGKVEVTSAGGFLYLMNNNIATISNVVSENFTGNENAFFLDGDTSKLYLKNIEIDKENKGDYLIGYTNYTRNIITFDNVNIKNQNFTKEDFDYSLPTSYDDGGSIAYDSHHDITTLEFINTNNISDNNGMSIFVPSDRIYAGEDDGKYATKSNLQIDYEDITYNASNKINLYYNLFMEAPEKGVNRIGYKNGNIVCEDWDTNKGEWGDYFILENAENVDFKDWKFCKDLDSESVIRIGNVYHTISYYAYDPEKEVGLPGDINYVTDKIGEIYFKVDEPIDLENRFKRLGKTFKGVMAHGAKDFVDNYYKNWKYDVDELRYEEGKTTLFYAVYTDDNFKAKVCGCNADDNNDECPIHGENYGDRENFVEVATAAHLNYIDDSLGDDFKYYYLEQDIDFDFDDISKQINDEKVVLNLNNKTLTFNVKEIPKNLDGLYPYVIKDTDLCVSNGVITQKEGSNELNLIKGSLFMNNVKVTHVRNSNILFDIDADSFDNVIDNSEFSSNSGSVDVLYKVDNVSTKVRNSRFIGNLLNEAAINMHMNAMIYLDGEVVIKDNGTNNDKNIVFAENSSRGLLVKDGDILSSESEIHLSPRPSTAASNYAFFESWKKGTIDGYDTPTTTLVAFLPESIFKVDSTDENDVISRGNGGKLYIDKKEDVATIEFSDDITEEGTTKLVATQYVKAEEDVKLDKVRINEIPKKAQKWDATTVGQEIWGVDDDEPGHEINVETKNTYDIKLVDVHSQWICGCPIKDEYVERCKGHFVNGEIVYHDKEEDKVSCDLVTSIDGLKDSSKNFVRIDGDIEIDEEITISADKYICLNGHSLILKTSSINMFNVVAGKKLTIANCKEEGGLKSSIDDGIVASNYLINNTGSLYLYNVKIGGKLADGKYYQTKKPIINIASGAGEVVLDGVEFKNIEFGEEAVDEVGVINAQTGYVKPINLGDIKFNNNIFNTAVLWIDEEDNYVVKNIVMSQNNPSKVVGISSLAIEGTLKVASNATIEKTGSGSVHGDKGGLYIADEGNMIVGNALNLSENHGKYGAGAYITGKLEVGENIFVLSNIADEKGGGLYLSGNNTEITTHCKDEAYPIGIVFYENKAKRGAALYTDGAKIENVEQIGFSKNETINADSSSHGIFTFDNEVDVLGTKFIFNENKGNGSIIENFDGGDALKLGEVEINAYDGSKDSFFSLKGTNTVSVKGNIGINTPKNFKLANFIEMEKGKLELNKLAIKDVEFKNSVIKAEKGAVIAVNESIEIENNKVGTMAVQLSNASIEFLSAVKAVIRNNLSNGKDKNISFRDGSYFKVDDSKGLLTKDSVLSFNASASDADIMILENRDHIVGYATPQETYENFAFIPEETNLFLRDEKESGWKFYIGNKDGHKNIYLGPSYVDVNFRKTLEEETPESYYGTEYIRLDESVVLDKFVVGKEDDKWLVDGNPDEVKIFNTDVEVGPWNETHNLLRSFTYNIKFTSGGKGEVKDEYKEVKDLSYGKNYILPEAADALTEPTGFMYWGLVNATAELSKQYKPGESVKNLTQEADATVEFSAVWEDTKFKINFYANDDKEEKVTSQSEIKQGESITLPSEEDVNKFKPVGKVFNYWYVDGDLEKNEVDFSVYKVSSDVNFIAAWRNDDTYKVSFDYNDGRGIYKKVTATKDLPIEKTLIPVDPTKQSDKTYNYSFKHWSIDKSGEEFDFDTPITADLTLYAIWNKEKKPNPTPTPTPVPGPTGGGGGGGNGGGSHTSVPMNQNIPMGLSGDKNVFMLDANTGFIYDGLGNVVDNIIFGGHVNLDGTWVDGFGNKHNKDGSITNVMGATYYLDGSIKTAEGITFFTDGTYMDQLGIKYDINGNVIMDTDLEVEASEFIFNEDGSITAPNGIVYRTDGTALLTDGRVVYPDGTIVLPTEENIVVVNELGVPVFPEVIDETPMVMQEQLEVINQVPAPIQAPAPAPVIKRGTIEYDVTSNSYKVCKVNSDGSKQYYNDSWVQVSNANGKETWCLTDKNGGLVTGWAKKDGDWYYMSNADANKGELTKGATTIDGVSYSFDNEGKLIGQRPNITKYTVVGADNMIAGVDGNWNDKGNGTTTFTRNVKKADGTIVKEDAKGWLMVDGEFYFFDDTGKMKTGLIVSDGKYYYLSDKEGKKGQMISGENVVIDGHNYSFDKATGACLTIY